MAFFFFFSFQAQQVNSMFPHVPLQAITLDLADTHSVSLTVDRILNNSIYIPEEGGMVNNDATPLPNAAESTEPPPVRQQESIPQSHAPITAPPPPPPHTHSSLEESSQHSRVDADDELQENTQQSHDFDAQNAPEPQKSHDFDAQDTTDHLNSITHHQSHHTTPPEAPQGESELRQRRVDGSTVIQMAKGGCDSKDAAKPDSKSGFLSTKESYSRLFSSLQERKAELLRKAKRYHICNTESTHLVTCVFRPSFRNCPKGECQGGRRATASQIRGLSPRWGGFYQPSSQMKLSICSHCSVHNYASECTLNPYELLYTTLS